MAVGLRRRSKPWLGCQPRDALALSGPGSAPRASEFSSRPSSAARCTDIATCQEGARKSKTNKKGNVKKRRRRTEERKEEEAEEEEEVEQNWSAWHCRATLQSGTHAMQLSEESQNRRPQSCAEFVHFPRRKVSKRQRWALKSLGSSRCNYPLSDVSSPSVYT